MCMCVCGWWDGSGAGRGDYICDYLMAGDQEREAASLCGVVLVMVLEHSD